MKNGKPFLKAENAKYPLSLRTTRKRLPDIS
jgi:hypothetical protein